MVSKDPNISYIIFFYLGRKYRQFIHLHYGYLIKGGALNLSIQILNT